MVGDLQEWRRRAARHSTLDAHTSPDLIAAVRDAGYPFVTLDALVG